MSVRTSPRFLHRLASSGPELDGLVEDGARVVAPPQVQQRVTKARQIIRGRLSPDRARYPFHCVIVLPAMQRDQAKQMQRVGMRRIESQDLLATDLGVELLPGEKMLQAGLVKRGDRGWRRSRTLAAEGPLATSTSSAAAFAFAGIHRPVT